MNTKTTGSSPKATPRPAPTTEHQALLDALGLALHVAGSLPARNRSLTSVSALLLAYVHGSTSPSEVASTAGVAPANVTNVVHRLITAGMVERRNSVDDLRRVEIRLTDEGLFAMDRMFLTADLSSFAGCA
jgi:DNA-binding MarR family transcriptional regulator